MTLSLRDVKEVNNVGKYILRTMMGLHLSSTVAGGCEIMDVNTARRIAQTGEKNAFQAGNLIASILGTPRRWLENIWMNLKKGIWIVPRGGLRYFWHQSFRCCSQRVALLL
jgi:hypothetical protein